MSLMGKNSKKCQKALLRIADDVRDINHKLTYFLENYREDYYKAISKENYKA